MKCYKSREEMVSDLAADLSDCDKVLIPLMPVFHTRDPKTGRETEYRNIGMILCKCGKMNRLLPRNAAEDVLNDGWLSKLGIPIEFSDLGIII